VPDTGKMIFVGIATTAELELGHVSNRSVNSASFHKQCR
jgi:hypothetical protein